MRIRVAALFVFSAVGVTGWGQSNTAVTFLAEVLAKYPLTALTQTIQLTGSADWTSGSLHETGSATLQGGVDGSSSVQLSLGPASRSETRTALGTSRSCEWTDASGTAHPLNDPDCSVAVPWFSPLMLVQPATTIAALLNISDDGQVIRNGSTLRQVSYVTPLQLNNTAYTNALTAATRISVLFDPNTLLPSSVEYTQHSDVDFNTGVKVRVIYSDYQMISGYPIPFRISRYVNNALQLSITVNSASTK